MKAIVCAYGYEYLILDGHWIIPHKKIEFTKYVLLDDWGNKHIEPTIVATGAFSANIVDYIDMIEE